MYNSVTSMSFCAAAGWARPGPTQTVVITKLLVVSLLCRYDSENAHGSNHLGCCPLWMMAHHSVKWHWDSSWLVFFLPVFHCWVLLWVFFLYPEVVSDNSKTTQTLTLTLCLCVYLCVYCVCTCVWCLNICMSRRISGVFFHPSRPYSLEVGSLMEPGAQARFLS